MPLVDIPTTTTLQGFSPVLNVRQRIDSRALPNLIAFANAFHRQFGRPLIVTEAARSRARQDYLWKNRVALGIAVARPYTSRHDEITKATALDLGSGIATGSTPAAQWAHNNCKQFGIHWTGAGFNESWHFEVEPGTETAAIDLDEIEGLFMALTDQQQTDLYNAVMQLQAQEIVPGQGYSWSHAVNDKTQEIKDALLKPTEETKPYKPIDVIVSHVKATLAAVKAEKPAAGIPGTVADINYERLTELIVAELAPTFAALNANIDDQPTEFKIVPTS